MATERERTTGQGGADDGAGRLLAEVRRLLAELHPGGAPAEVGLDADLERELGLDSLSRAELLLRLEDAFGVSLPESILATAETPRALLRAVRAATAPRPPDGSREVRSAAVGEAGIAPEAARTLQEVLDWHVLHHPGRIHVHLLGAGDTPEPITYGALRDGALAVAAGLADRGLQPGETVAIMLPTGRDYLLCFLGILYAGGIPVPIYPPTRPSQLEDHLQRHARILDNARTVALITVPEAKPLARLLQSRVGALRGILTPADLHGAAGAFGGLPARGRDTAFLQYTSGSTGQPKGVVLSHANLLANIRIMGRAVRADSSDVFVSWLPLYHDMGLIGAWLGSLYYAIPLVLMSPLAFLARPSRWLWAIHHHRGTLSAAPNFAFELCLIRIRGSGLEGLDLGSLRRVFNGAEPVSPQTLRRFSARFEPYGFRPEAMAPVYGLAEAAVGLAFPPLGRAPLIDRIRRDPFLRSGHALPLTEGDGHALEFVGSGQPLPGYGIRIVDEGGRELPERQQGRLEFRGPSATSGYFRNPEATRRLFDGEWLDSGDLAYLAEGEIYVTGRVKDVIIRGGRNIHPQELEAAVGELPGVRQGCVAVFGSPDPATGTERLVVMAETRETGPAAREALHARINGVAVDLLGIPPDETVLVPPRTVLKTSSGKIRRAASRELYEQGRSGRPPRAAWLQFARLALASLPPRWRRTRQASGRFAFAAWAHVIFWSLAIPVWLTVLLLPRMGWRWAVMRAGARLLLRLTGTPLRVDGAGSLDQGDQRVLVANHQSYLDGVVLVAALPRPVRFVAKAELRRKPIPRLFLQRIGVEFVERFDRRQGVADAERTIRSVRAGSALLSFPEGTFRSMAGLLPFRMGAFLAAAQAGVAVVPIAIRGTRSILRGRSHFPHRGTVSVRIGKPLDPAGTDWAAAVQLRNAARAWILDHAGEPDLGAGGAPNRM